MLARANARVALHCREGRAGASRVAREIRKATGQSSPVVSADLAHEDARRDLYGKVSRQLGPPVLLVHNAGIYFRNPFEETDDSAFLERWRNTMAVNLEAAAHLTLLALPAMRAARFGRIVMISSRAAFRAETDCADYAASKAGMVNLARSLARNEGRHGITSNSVCPGWVETDMSAADLAAHGDSIRREIPLGRVATPDDVAGAVLFLVSPLGSYVNGAAIPLNGGSFLH
jgi:NAD(P)-dependent dehydrogenase (short-subunit alcohol dehydrogenase family)